MLKNYNPDASAKISNNSIKNNSLTKHYFFPLRSIQNTELAKAFSLSALVMLRTPFYSVLSLIYLPRDSIFEKRGFDWKNITKCQAFHVM